MGNYFNKNRNMAEQHPEQDDTKVDVQDTTQLRDSSQEATKEPTVPTPEPSTEKGGTVATPPEQILESDAKEPVLDVSGEPQTTADSSSEKPPEPQEVAQKTETTAQEKTDGVSMPATDSTVSETQQEAQAVEEQMPKETTTLVESKETITKENEPTPAVPASTPAEDQSTLSQETCNVEVEKTKTPQASEIVPDAPITDIPGARMAEQTTIHEPEKSVDDVSLPKPAEEITQVISGAQAEEQVAKVQESEQTADDGSSPMLTEVEKATEDLQVSSNTEQAEGQKETTASDNVQQELQPVPVPDQTQQVPSVTTQDVTISSEVSEKQGQVVSNITPTEGQVDVVQQDEKSNESETAKQDTEDLSATQLVQTPDLAAIDQSQAPKSENAEEALQEKPSQSAEVTLLQPEHEQKVDPEPQEFSAEVIEKEAPEAPVQEEKQDFTPQPQDLVPGPSVEATAETPEQPKTEQEVTPATQEPSSEQAVTEQVPAEAPVQLEKKAEVVSSPKDPLDQVVQNILPVLPCLQTVTVDPPQGDQQVGSKLEERPHDPVAEQLQDVGQEAVASESVQERQADISTGQVRAQEGEVLLSDDVQISQADPALDQVAEQVPGKETGGTIDCAQLPQPAEPTLDQAPVSEQTQNISEDVKQLQDVQAVERTSEVVSSGAPPAAAEDVQSSVSGTVPDVPEVAQQVPQEEHAPGAVLIEDAPPATSPSEISQEQTPVAQEDALQLQSPDSAGDTQPSAPALEQPQVVQEPPQEPAQEQTPVAQEDGPQLQSPDSAGDTQPSVPALEQPRVVQETSQEKQDGVQQVPEQHNDVQIAQTEQQLSTGSPEVSQVEQPAAVQNTEEKKPDTPVAGGP